MFGVLVFTLMVLPVCDGQNVIVSGSLHLNPPCVQDGHWMNMTCCLNATSPVTWYTSITDKKTTLESSGLPNATDVTFNDTCQVYTFIATLAINGTRISCLYGNVPSINVTVLVTTGYIQDVRVQALNHAKQEKNIEFNLSLVSADTVCPLNDPLEYTVEVIGSPYQTGIVQIRKDRGRKEILLLGVTVPINSIAKLQNLTFNISFHYRRGRVHSIPLLEIANPEYEVGSSNKDGVNNPGMGSDSAAVIGGSTGAAITAAIVLLVIVLIVVIVMKPCSKRGHEPMIEERSMRESSFQDRLSTAAEGTNEVLQVGTCTSSTSGGERRTATDKLIRRRLWPTSQQRDEGGSVIGDKPIQRTASAPLLAPSYVRRSDNNGEGRIKVTVKKKPPRVASVSESEATQ